MSFPISERSPVEHAGPLPAETDVAIIGGGIIGVMTAWQLALAGVRCVVIEKGRVAGEQSSRNWGWIRAQGRDAAELPIAMEAKRMWQSIAQQVGEDIGLRQTGAMYLAASDKKLAEYHEWLKIGQAGGLDTVALSPAEIKRLMPGAARQWKGGIWTASDMRAEPWVTVPAVARMAVREGAQIVENCAVRGLDVQGGRIAGVVTEAGLVKAAEVVVAGGAWSRLLLQRHGIDIPQLSVRSTVVATEASPEVFAGQAVDNQLAWRRREDGGYTLAPEAAQEIYVGRDAFRSLRAYAPQLWADPLGTRILGNAPWGFPDAVGTPRKWGDGDVSPFERMRVLNPPPNLRRVRNCVRDFERRFPSVGKVRVKASWAGMIDAMPDVVPIVDRAESLPGLTVATGMSGHGFGIGPAFGRIIAAMITGGEVGHDMSRFRLGRFGDGSDLDIGPII